MPQLLWFLAGCTATLIAAAGFFLARRKRTLRLRPNRVIRVQDRQRPRRIVVNEPPTFRELSAALGSELASLASSVEGHAQLLCEAIGEPRRVAGRAEKLLDCVNQVRLFSEKMQAFSQVPQKEMEPTDIRELLTSLVCQVEDLARGRVQINLSIAPSLPMALANPRALRNAILFLIQCVLDLEPNASSLLLQAQSQESDKDDTLCVCIEIEAVPEEDAEIASISQPSFEFNYLAASRILQPQVKSFTLDHASGLNAISRFTLAATEQRSPIGEGIDEEVFASGELFGPHVFGGVLVLEGNRMILDMIARELDQTRRNTVVCADGIAARTLFDATPERFELLILEKESKLLGGEAMALHALQGNPDIEIVLITAGPKSAIHPDLALHPRLAVLRKPFGLNELRSILAGSLGPEPNADEGGDPQDVDLELEPTGHDLDQVVL